MMFIFNVSYGLTSFELSLYEYNLNAIFDVSPTLSSAGSAVAFKNSQLSIFIFSGFMGFIL